jgi:hypothetical protein
VHDVKCERDGTLDEGERRSQSRVGVDDLERSIQIEKGRGEQRSFLEQVAELMTGPFRRWF